MRGQSGHPSREAEEWARSSEADRQGVEAIPTAPPPQTPLVRAADLPVIKETYAQ